MLWMANGLDDNFDNEIVATLEQLFQECRMRDMAAEKKEKRELQRALDEQRAPASGGVTTSQSDHDVGSTVTCANGTQKKITAANAKRVSSTIKVKLSRKRRR
jgi:hypothetical protein